jgi:hypothetical protein
MSIIIGRKEIKTMLTMKAAFAIAQGKGTRNITTRSNATGVKAWQQIERRIAMSNKFFDYVFNYELNEAVKREEASARYDEYLDEMQKKRDAERARIFKQQEFRREGALC